MIFCKPTRHGNIQCKFQSWTPTAGHSSSEWHFWHARLGLTPRVPGTISYLPWQRTYIYFLRSLQRFTASWCVESKKCVPNLIYIYISYIRPFIFDNPKKEDTTFLCKESTVTSRNHCPYPLNYHLIPVSISIIWPNWSACNWATNRHRNFITLKLVKCGPNRCLRGAIGIPCCWKVASGLIHPLILGSPDLSISLSERKLQYFWEFYEINSQQVPNNSSKTVHPTQSRA